MSELMGKPSNNTTGLMSAGVDTESSARPRNRRGGSSKPATASRLTPGGSPVPSRGVSPLPSPRLSTTKLASSGRSSPVNTFGKGLLEGTWAPSWSSVQGFASSFISGGESGYNSESSRPNSRNGGKPRSKSVWKSFGGGGTSNRKQPDSWGPAPIKGSRPKAEDIGSGSLAEREAALRAMKMASVLESHEGVNGGLDVAGKFKRRNSDENMADGAKSPVDDDQLVYLHHVQRTDTYAGIVLRYNCQENAFRKANGLWTRDNIQMCKHLKVPVDACEIKGRPCDPPSFYNQKVDHLAATPQPESYFDSEAAGSSKDVLHDDFFAPRNGRAQSLPEQDQPWTHVRWVKLDSMQEPVEIVRVSRKAMGYFPPRRKASFHAVSTFTTPRHSLEAVRSTAAASNDLTMGSPGSVSSRRQSSLSGRPNLGSLGTSSSTGRSRGNSLGPADGVPAWMRRPGGVGSMSRSVKTPGPAKDYLNNWVNKRIPGFNIDNLPSMSVMGSESAAWGFAGKGEDGSAGIVDRHFDEGQEATPAPGQGIGLEQAANAIETWMRSTWSKKPGTPHLGSYRKSQEEDLDLIELAAPHSDDGRPVTPVMGIPQPRISDSRRNSEDGTVRGRPQGPSSAKAKKAD